jgi:hypothetical protein
MQKEEDVFDKCEISMDGYKLLDEYRFFDNDYSGSNIIRPAVVLEPLNVK